MKLARLLHGLSARVIGSDADVEIVRATIDSRRVAPGVVFAACRGATSASRDGHTFIGQALQAGASALLVEDAARIPDGCPVPVAIVRDARAAVARIAERLLGTPSEKLQLVGVTGTNGKTTTTTLLARASTTLGRKGAVFGTLGIGAPDAPRTTGFTTPEAEVASSELARLVDEGYERAAMEVSSHALATARVDGLHFAAAGFTNLSRDHLDFHGTMDAYFDAKARLFRELLPAHAPAVLPADDDDDGVHARLRALRPDAITWGLHESARLRATDVRHGLDGIACTLHFDGVEAALRSPLLGAFNLENLLVSAGLLVGLGHPLADAVRALALAGPPPGRMQRVPGEGATVVVDYAHTPDALERALLVARSVTAGRVFVVFGCGGDRDAGKRPLMGRIADDLADVAIITDDNPRSEASDAILDAVEQGFVRMPRATPGADGHLSTGTHLRVANRRLAIRTAVRAAHDGDLVLIAGKGHEKEQLQGAVRYPFDDVTEAERARSGASSPAFLDAAFVVAALAAREVQIRGVLPAVFAGVSTDSRAVLPGSIFVALRGDRFDGHEFVVGALQGGAGAALVESNSAFAQRTDLPLIVVDEALRALQDLAHAHLLAMPALRLCLTGSNGKTTTKELCLAALRSCLGFDAVVGTEGNLNNHIGVPLTALRVEPHHRVAVIEMGMNHIGEIASYCRYAPPHIALITNIGTAHAGNVGGIEGVARAKSEIFEALDETGAAVVNADDPRCVREAQNKVRGRQVAFGRAPWADVRITSVVDHESGGQRIDLIHAGQLVSTSIPLDGRHNAQNAAGAVAAAVALGFDFKTAAHGVESVARPHGRLERRRASCGALLLDDSYNANPDSMEAGLSTLRHVAGGRRAIACLGPMLELGELALQAHRHIGAAAAQAGVHHLYVCGPDGRAMAEGAQNAGLPASRITWAADSSALAPLVAAAVASDDVVLVKGSRGARMERVVGALLPPAHASAKDVH